MTTKVYGHEGGEVREIELSDEVFAGKISLSCIHDSIRAELANRRVGTAKVKTRGEVRGSTRKPWRQKGTGRARAGSRKSPLWTGGGVIFGPRPRDYTIRLPRKVRRKGLTSVLALKAQQQRLKVVENIAVASGKTRELRDILERLAESRRVVLVVRDGEDAAMVRRAGRNLPWLRILSFNRLSAHALFYGRTLLLEEGAARGLEELFGARREPVAAAEGQADAIDG